MQQYLAVLLACHLVAHSFGMTENNSSNQQEAAAQRDIPSPELSKVDQLQAEVVRLFKEKQYDKALVLANQILEIREKILGPDHLMVAFSLQDIAEILVARKKLKEAAEAYRRCLTIYEKATGVNNPQLNDSIGRYICLLTMMGKSDEITDVRTRLFKLENGFDESVSGSGQSSKKFFQGRAVSLPKPDYPEEAKWSRISGSVVMKVKVNEAGEVMELKALCGPRVLVKGSETAVWKARFEPAVINGQRVQFTSTIIYKFYDE
jgi:TonB family protein